MFGLLFVWPLKTGFTVHVFIALIVSIFNFIFRLTMFRGLWLEMRTMVKEVAESMLPLNPATLEAEQL